MVYGGYSFQGSRRDLPLFEELRDRYRAVFLTQYFGPRNSRIVQAILDDDAAMRVIRDAYTYFREHPKETPQRTFIDRLDVRVRKLAEEAEDRRTPRYHRY